MERTLEQLGIDRLSVDERLDLIGRIWDSLAPAEDGHPIPDWHRREVDRRRASADADPDTSIPWDVGKARLADKS